MGVIEQTRAVSLASDDLPAGCRWDGIHLVPPGTDRPDAQKFDNMTVRSDSDMQTLCAAVRSFYDEGASCVI